MQQGHSTILTLAAIAVGITILPQIPLMVKD